MQSRITVLMPLKHHHPLYLNKALDSIFQQSSLFWRLLIIVDPTDGRHFRKILHRSVLDDRVKMITNEGKGLAGAFNTGMRNCSTDFAAILLADDRWSLDAVSVLSEHIENYPDVDFFYSSRRFINENDEAISSIYESQENFGMEDFLIASPVKHLLCWRVKKGLEIGGMDESLSPHGVDDYDFPWSMAEQGARFRAVRDCLYLYRDHRECFRLTTHVPLKVIKRLLRRMMRKHHAPDYAITAKIAEAERTYLRECLFKSTTEKWIKQTLGYDARRGFRRVYR